MENLPRFHRDDVVTHKKKSGYIGMMINDSFNDIDEEGAKTENHENEQQLVDVLWLGDDTEEEEEGGVQNVNDIILLDRVFLLGDCVASASDPTGQIGIVRDVNISVDLLAPDGSVVKDVSSRVLKRATEFAVGDYLVLGNWVGRVYDVSVNVTVLTDVGSSCQVVEADGLLLKPVGGTFSYYPGQRVRAGSPSVLNNSLEGTVTQVTVGSLFINWIASAHGSSTAPSKVQSPKNVKLLSCLAHASWKLGEGCFPLPSVPRPYSITQTGQGNDCESEKTLQEEENSEKAYMIINTSRKVDVLWQDGTIGHGIDSKLMLLIRSPGEHEFFAQDYVVEQAHDDISKTQRRYGVIQSVNAKERIVCVRWLKSEYPLEFDMEEIVSVYELDSHPDYCYGYGEVVFRLAPVSATTFALSNDPRTEKHMIPSGEASEDLSWVGFITDLKNGNIEVTWGNGTVSMVGPQEICVADQDYANQDESTTIDLNTTISLLHQNKRENVDAEGLTESQDEDTTSISEEESALITSNVSQGFDTAKDPLDHHFLDKNCQINNGRKWLKKVQKDWSILQNNLPDEIYVRVYEDRMDLIRACIVGPYGTPYHDGLFLFDFYLPPDYPDIPPLAHYHSGGWRINPNLYEEGKVCLSLLNTWTGKKNEVWDPSSSSILQVLVSLQGLVLNSRPYFNEPGYDKQVGTIEGEKNSLSYDENTFLLNCKTMMYLMRQPPKDFEEVIKDHFKRRGWYILKSCDAYLRGSLISSLSRDASTSMDSNSNSTSVGFKLMLAKIMPKLYSALSEVGADCAEFNHLVQGDK